MSHVAPPLPTLLVLALFAAGIGLAPAATSQNFRAADETPVADEAAFAGLVEQAAVAAVAARIASPDHFALLSCRMDGGSRPAAGPVALEVLEAEAPSSSGVARARLRVLVAGNPEGEARATVRGEVRGPVLVSRTTLRRGEPVAADAVEIAEASLTRLNDPPLRGASEVRGLVPVRTIAPGQVLTASLFGGPTVVRRGRPVTLKIESPRLSVVARGTARRDGAVGDVITAENASTGVVVVGEVQPDGSLLVTRGGPRRKP